MFTVVENHKFHYAKRNNKVQCHSAVLFPTLHSFKIHECKISLTKSFKAGIAILHAMHYITRFPFNDFEWGEDDSFHHCGYFVHSSSFSSANEMYWSICLLV